MYVGWMDGFWMERWMVSSWWRFSHFPSTYPIHTIQPLEVDLKELMDYFYIAFSKKTVNLIYRAQSTALTKTYLYIDYAKVLFTYNYNFHTLDLGFQKQLKSEAWIFRG